MRPIFNTLLTQLRMSQRGFAYLTGANERSVRRWCSGSQDVPPMAMTLLRIMERFPEVRAWLAAAATRPYTAPDAGRGVGSRNTDKAA